MNATLKAFDYPASLLASTEYWAILLRPKQITLGSMVLAVRDPDTRSVGALSPEAALELPHHVAVIEKVLREEYGASKFNYLCLMMVDPQVHFHVLPRYIAPVAFEGRHYVDERWPNPPDMSATIKMDKSTRQSLYKILKAAIEREGLLSL